MLLDRSTPASFRGALERLAPSERDAWLDRFLGLDDALPADGPELAAGCVPYMPCGVATLLDVIDHARVTKDDVFVDVGAGLGRATAFVHLATGARAVGVEIQSDLARRARAFGLHDVTIVEGDASRVVRSLTNGTVFFFYCPFSGDRLRRVLADLESIARAHTIRVCTLDLPLPPCTWLEETHASNGLAIHRSR